LIRARVTALIAVAAMALAACTPGGEESPEGTPIPTSSPSVAVEPLTAGLTDLASAPGADLKPERLAEGLVPPTNRWFSGLVFGPDALPVFPLPLSFGVTEGGDGFGFGVPEVHSDGKTIFGGFRPTVQVTVPGTTGWEVTAYDTASVTLTALGDSGPLGHVRVTQGSPLVSFTAEDEVSLSTLQSFVEQDGRPTASDGTNEYVALVSDGGAIGEQAVSLPAGGTATWVALPQGGDAEAVLAAANPVTATHASWAIDGDDARTTISYETADGEPTLFATRPHHRDGMADECSLGTYPSAYGEMTLCSGTELSWTAPLREAPLTLGLDVLTDEEAADVVVSLEADVAEEPPYPADTYFGGKALARDAQLWTIATELGRDDLAEALRTRALTELRDWAEPAGCVDEGDARCFFFDETNSGIVGQTPSFGSEEFNDHHFHYGYFLYAAGVFAHDDAELAEELAPVMDLLAADIASPEAGEQFPQWRSYDAYASHAWASGTSPFADGNNQESTSEAINAWVGLRHWAAASGNQGLEQQGAWLQANEIATALAYWTNFDLEDPVYEGYGHSYIPLNFGGKRDFATWFSAEPAAGLAIQVLPVTPASRYLGDDPARVGTNLEEGLDGKGYTQQYGDLLLAYSALAGEEQRKAALEVVDEVPVDDGNSRTFLKAWLHRLGH